MTEELEQAPEPVLGSLSPLREVVRAKEAAESSAILRALDLTHWNRKRAARMLNIDYKALLYRMKKLSIDDRPPTDLLTAAGGSASPAVRQSFGAESSI